MSATASSRGGGGPVDGDGVETGAESSAPGLSGSIADGKANDGTEVLRGEMAQVLAERFNPHHADPEYRAEMAAEHMPLPDATRDSAMVTFTASDGHLSMRALTYGEITDALLEAGFRRVVVDDDTVERAAKGKASDGTEALRGELARLIAGAQYGPDMWSVPTDDDAAQIAGVVIEAGFRRVAGDDDLANRVGHAIQHTLAWVADQDYGKASDAWADVGRAAVRAISQSAPSSSQAGSSVRHVCCPHCTARTGSCVRCGVRDAEDDGQLCGQCDREVEAEVAGRAIRGGRDD